MKAFLHIVGFVTLFLVALKAIDIALNLFNHPTFIGADILAILMVLSVMSAWAGLTFYTLRTFGNPTQKEIEVEAKEEEKNV
jgi:hypothetical protein